MGSAAVLIIVAMAVAMFGAAKWADRRRHTWRAEWVILPAGVVVLGVAVAVWLDVLHRAEAGRITVVNATEAATAIGALMVAMVSLAAWTVHRAESRRAASEAQALRQAEAERAVRENEHRLLGFLEAMPLGVLVTLPPDGRPYYANEEAVRLLGKGVAPEYTAASLPEVYHAYVAGTEQLYPAEDTALVHALRGLRSRLDDMEIRRPGGTVTPIEVWGNPVRALDGRIEYALVAFTDISERKARERIAADQAALLDLALDPIFVWDADYTITYWNRGAERTYGYRSEEALGRNPRELLATEFPCPPTEIEARLRETGQWEGELTHRCRDGTSLVVSGRCVMRYGADGQPIDTMEVNRDITGRKRAEQQLAERATELADANRELARSNHELEQFAYVASHDLSEPLRAISGPISLLARRYRGQLDEEADQFIEFAVDGCMRMQSMIDGLLAFSRVGRVERAIGAVDCNVIMKAVLAALGPTIDEYRATVTVDPLPVVTAEPSQLTQVFQNLVSNALKFVAPGTAPRVSVGAEPVGPMWRFTVTDNGIGIDPRHRERVFGMFKRLHGRDEYPGTGIGLALVKKIVERHGGRVGIESNDAGRGTEFWFTLPGAREMAT